MTVVKLITKFGNKAIYKESKEFLMNRPIYQNLVEDYRSKLITRQILPGEKIDSITEIQKKYGVVRETAKKVLNILANEGYIIKRRGQGSFAVKRQSKVKTWAIILPFYSVHYREVLLEFQMIAARDNREIIHFSCNNDPREEMRLVGQMIHQQYEAVIVIPTRDATKTDHFYHQISKEPVQLIIFDFYDHEDILFNSVVQYYSKGIVKGLDYLKSQKDGNIAFVGMTLWRDDNKIQDLFKRRYMEYIDEQDAFIFDQGTVLTKEIIEADNITGIICPDDVVAIKTIGQLKESGVNVPEDVNIVSYGNTDLSKYFTPKITSIDSDYRNMVRKVSDLIRRKKRSTELKRIIVEPELIVRES